jgi:transposase
MVEPKPSDVHRIEVITGTGRRRRFSESEKARIVAETLEPGVVVSEIARRHDLTPQQLFGWRRAACRRVATGDGKTEAPFVPAVLDIPAREAEAAPEEQKYGVDDMAPLIGFDMNGASVWVCPGADTGMVTAIIRALKASK